MWDQGTHLDQILLGVYAAVMHSIEADHHAVRDNKSLKPLSRATHSTVLYEQSLHFHSHAMPCSAPKLAFSLYEARDYNVGDSLLYDDAGEMP
jgi:hypothetical protein